MTGPRGTAQALPDVLAAALQRAHAAERVAEGEARIPAFRLTRCLLGGARRAGYPPRRLAECIGITVSTLRTRVGADGWIGVQDFADLAEIGDDTVRGWAAEGQLPSTPPKDGEPNSFLASELIRALISATPQSPNDDGHDSGPSH